MGIRTSEDLVEKYKDLKNLQKLSEKTKIMPQLLSTWLKISGLLRIKGLN